MMFLKIARACRGDTAHTGDANMASQLVLVLAHALEVVDSSVVESEMAGQPLKLLI